MGRKTIAGLKKRGCIWHIQKQIKGYGGLYESTGTSNLEEAERYLIKRLEEIRVELRYGISEAKTFQQAATKYLNESTKRSISRGADTLKILDPYIGSLSLDQVHSGTLENFIGDRREAGIKSATVRRDLAVVRRILNLAARKWRDQFNRAWLTTVPLLEMPDWEDAAEPCPLSWEEQTRFFKLLPDYLHIMALFGVNTGLREQGICWLRWDWEIPIPELRTSLFITPARRIQYEDGVWPGEKNKEDQVAVLNKVACSIVNGQRGLHGVYVFPYQGRRLTRLHNSAWKNAWKKAGLPTDGTFSKGPHNLKHTFGRRLRAAGVPLETRKVLLHHTSGDITTHYSPAEIEELIDAVERIAPDKWGKSGAVTLLRKRMAS